MHGRRWDSSGFNYYLTINLFLFSLNNTVSKQLFAIYTSLSRFNYLSICLTEVVVIQHPHAPVSKIRKENSVILNKEPLSNHMLLPVSFLWTAKQTWQPLVPSSSTA
jgi:hypothetical protein